ncbi:MAG: glycosyltransferase [Actinomycetota bacterium]|nr:glycosyltransferase [Actinomycetota bacterium]
MSVIIPLLRAEQARSVPDLLAGLGLRRGDQVVVAAAPGLPDLFLPSNVSIVKTDRESSPSKLRNVGAEHAGAEWLLFVDADQLPASNLIDAYFEEPIDRRCGVLIGCQRTARPEAVLAAYHSIHLRDLGENLLVRRETWESLGGFLEGVRRGAASEFCARAVRGGWIVSATPAAQVVRQGRPPLSAVLRDAARIGAAKRWLDRRSSSFEVQTDLVAAGHDAMRRRGRTLFHGLSLLARVAEAAGRAVGDNRAPRSGSSTDQLPSLRAQSHQRRLVVMIDAFPARSETFVYNELLQLQASGWDLRVEAGGRAERPERSVARELSVAYLEDDPLPQKTRDLVWLLARHPLRSLQDRLRRRHWSEEATLPLSALASPARRLARDGSPHIHAHFAATAALNAMRLSRMLGCTFSISAHAYEIFQRPANLREKIEASAFTVAECEYTADHLRRLVDERHRPRIHRVATGVDPDRLRRRNPYPGGRTVVAVGRLIEKKGFPILIAAAAELRESGSLERMIIAGDGPLRPHLEEQVTALGLGDLVELRGNVWGGQAVGELLESADLVAIPAVLAADGDRDAMPVISYEALAMEVPVVASDLVGLPEVVLPGWGRLVPPRDPMALATAIAELLDLPPGERAEMGAAGRAFICQHRDSRREVERLAKLLAAVRHPS